MSPLVESLKMKDGVVFNLEYHQNRLIRSLNELFPLATAIDLSGVLAGIQGPQTGLFKVRVLYGPSVERVEVEPYVSRSIKSLKVVYHNDIDYHLKFTDRQLLNSLYSQRESCDDIIIIKDGLVTDAFSANLLFFDGQRWFTPDSPLLKGTKRQLLLDNGLIAERHIKVDDFACFSKVGLINAMMDFDNMPEIDIKDISF